MCGSGSQALSRALSRALSTAAGEFAKGANGRLMGVGRHGVTASGVTAVPAGFRPDYRIVARFVEARTRATDHAEGIRRRLRRQLRWTPGKVARNLRNRDPATEVGYMRQPAPRANRFRHKAYFGFCTKPTSDACYWSRRTKQIVLMRCWPAFCGNSLPDLPKA